MHKISSEVWFREFKQKTWYVIPKSFWPNIKSCLQVYAIIVTNHFIDSQYHCHNWSWFIKRRNFSKSSFHVSYAKECPPILRNNYITMIFVVIIDVLYCVWLGTQRHIVYMYRSLRGCFFLTWLLFDHLAWDIDLTICCR